MTGKNLQEILSRCSPVKIRGTLNKNIQGISYNSQKCSNNWLFVAIKGYHTDGHKYIADALSHGAVAIIHEEPLPAYVDNAAYIQVSDSKNTLSKIAAAFYNFPAKRMKTIGVTGTDGKSTTVWFIHQLLLSCGEKSGFISTVHYQTGATPVPNPYRQSTPESLEINRILDEMLAKGKEYGILETTSHGLSLKNSRLADIRFNAGVFINISHEHLEFHGTFEQYRHDKANLFRQLKPKNSFAVINKDDPNHTYFSGSSKAPVFTYSTNDKTATLFARITHRDFSGTEFELFHNGSSYRSRLNIPGAFNVENLLAALLTVHKLSGIGMEILAAKTPAIEGVTGRVKTVAMGQAFNMIIDYAHTPESFEKIFSLVRPLTNKRLISVFGSAGERDTLKRPIQGEIASRFSDIVILTDEDPRGEESMDILEDIAGGCKGLERGNTLLMIPDRREAIQHAFRMAQKGDTVITLGKGHESNIIYSDGPVKWNEIEVCKKLLRELNR